MRYVLPYALFIADRNPEGGFLQSVDGDGSQVNGRIRPKYDTLIGVCNPFDRPVRVLYTFYRQDGKVATWSDGSNAGEWTLAPGHSLAMTCIPDNVFGPRTGTPVPPMDFLGYAVVSAVPDATGPELWLPIAACLGGGGPNPNHWNRYSPNVPVIVDGIARPFDLQRRVDVPVRQLVFPYCIPFFEDANHFGERSYRAGLVMTNHGASAVDVTVKYTVADVYPLAGKIFAMSFRLLPGATLSKELYSELTAQAAYPKNANSEGWIQISVPVATRMTAYLLNSNREFNDFGFGQSPWVRS